MPSEFRKELDALISAIFLVRDLINTPASDLTPHALASKAVEVGNRFKAKTKMITKEVLEKQFPMVHAVGQASVNAPAVVDMEWGSSKNPSVTLIGKGVTFDTGGLDVKPPSNMFLMKKDMGGAAHALALAQLIMEMDLSIHLRLILPCAENSIGSKAYRPSDVLTSRKGFTVEVSDTDAEGRLLLADALTAATEKPADYTIDFATLTGAARVAVGTEIAAYFSDDEGVSEKIKQHGDAENDAVWALPLWKGYEDQLPSSTADLKSCPSGGYGGAITAALFLKKFLVEKTKWVHFDVMGWNTRVRPGRPIGGEAMGLRAMYAFFKNLKA
ncbi:MAG: leucyl aminopeptidase family protein [Holosporaceae bacterium]|nr:MAG: leucyl aminopeptidase family protein [Holosporaceae bacterium]